MHDSWRDGEAGIAHQHLDFAQVGGYLGREVGYGLLVGDIQRCRHRLTTGCADLGDDLLEPFDPPGAERDREARRGQLPGRLGAVLAEAPGITAGRRSGCWYFFVIVRSSAVRR